MENKGKSGNGGKRRGGKNQGKSSKKSGGSRQDERATNRNSNNHNHANNNRRNNRRNESSKDEFVDFPPYWSQEECLRRYALGELIRGRLRVLNHKLAFVSCDRGSQTRDVLIELQEHRNRALDGDIVFVELLPEVARAGTPAQDTKICIQERMEQLQIDDDGGDCILDHNEWGNDSKQPLWKDDPIQQSLWAPQVESRRFGLNTTPDMALRDDNTLQRKGSVVFVEDPKTAATLPSEFNPGQQDDYTKLRPRRTLVGRLHRDNTRKPSLVLLTPCDDKLPVFECDGELPTQTGLLVKAEYIYGSWKATSPRPTCTNLTVVGQVGNVQDETKALMMQHGVDHGDFSPEALANVQAVVESGLQVHKTTLDWRPTPEHYKGRRDFRDYRIFTIDPTTAKDLDDALHIRPLPNNRVEIGVHIADVSHFVQPGTAIDQEAMRRATTVYMVDRTVPMLPRPLCEIACSLNENVERLAFSCVWTMNMDGTLENRQSGKMEPVWYGRSVIRSCARLDYATAQNIIDGKVAVDGEVTMDETLWPKSRRPSQGHTVAEVADDVRLMHRVAMARRRLRFQNGAIALNGVKLAFQLEEDGETPKLCAPYPIRDSNRLIEEYMLLANYLVAQRLITHAGPLAVLRKHDPPSSAGLLSVVTMAKSVLDFDIDRTSSQALQASLNRLGLECQDEIVIKCITQLLVLPMQRALYFAAGSIPPEDEWQYQHFALNIPYYTHFTSPIRRYPDVLVHRLLQATLDGPDAIATFNTKVPELQTMCDTSNDMREKARLSQEGSDKIFLCLYLRKKPLCGQMAVVLSVGRSSFTAFIPDMGIQELVNLNEHTDWIRFEALDTKDDDKVIQLTRTGNPPRGPRESWDRLDIQLFMKVRVRCTCRLEPALAVNLALEGPWEDHKTK